MLLVVLSALFIITATAVLSLFESSLVAIDELKLVTILRKKPANKQAIQQVFRKKREHLSAIVLLSTLVSISGSTMIGALAAREFNDLGLAVFTALLAYFMLVFAKVLPKLRAVQVAEVIVVKWAPVICVIYTLTRPILLLALVWTRLLPRNVDEKHHRDDLRSIIKHYNKRGAIGKGQRKLAEAALNSHQRTLAGLVNNNAPVVCLSSEANVASVEEIMRNSPCKRYVVLTDNKPSGVVLYRHLARCLVNGQSSLSVSEMVKKSINLTPETTLHEAITELQEARASIILMPGETLEQTRVVTVKQLYRALLR